MPTITLGLEALLYCSLTVPRLTLFVASFSTTVWVSRSTQSCRGTFAGVRNVDVEVQDIESNTNLRRPPYCAYLDAMRRWSSPNLVSCPIILVWGSVQ
ncbi:hypothetical protein L211DRAFT_520458 [Terfezia boudieri ATCC MYA-4762]|uniref:Uncharacterized protein n=1 Tax=Terfezia boudieri ATCC MYA-4762 TaxID=1051890 RepID=A0A3N4LG91_9PEZI|nr:hypothetical protein L211DRAFT_520458 [Terfezia boudieri ATCC MYA-4762]